MSNAHLDPADWPRESDQLDQNGDDLPAEPRSLAETRRGWRTTAPAGTPAPGTIALGDNMNVRLAEHASTGRPDTRRGVDDRIAGDLAPVEYDNTRREQPIVPKAPPARPRQGFTGADPARPAMAVRPSVIRAFDKGIADHPGPVVKVEQDAPRAATPRALGDLHGGLPNAGGTTGTQTEGVGPTRNTFRVLPKAWDATLVTPTPAAAPAPASTTHTRRSFR